MSHEITKEEPQEEDEEYKKPIEKKGNQIQKSVKKS